MSAMKLSAPSQAILIVGLAVLTLGENGPAPDLPDQCLPEAIHPSLRKNLTNALGKSYSVGMWVCEWPAAFIMSAMLRILMEEKIGYNVTQAGSGPGLPNAFFGMAGCQTPNNLSDPGCGDGPTETYAHVSVEGWTLAYQSLWDSIQKLYPDTAPVNLGSSGYVGMISMYLEREVVTNALNMEGATLQFFGSYNMSWHDHSKHFSHISDVNTSVLKPCEDTRLMLHEEMKFYAELTGDMDGVENVSGSIRGKCWYGHFWLAPSCRHDSSKCILYATGGAGWHIELSMQRATVWNMPIAPMVAKDWSSFAELPNQVKCLFYWWEPDPTFLLLNPTEIIFPAHVEKEWKQGIQTSAGQQVPIDKYVSRDLEDLAPALVGLIGALKIDLTDVVGMLRDQLISGDDSRTVACRWLQKHETIWEDWLPDETKCFSQFGMYNEISGKFVEDREDPTGLVCRACESGTYSVEITDGKGTTHVCKPCSPGYAQPSGAATVCDPCKFGEYQDAFGQASCIRCPQATYQDKNGQPSCVACPNQTSTLGLGSIEVEECRCESGNIDIARSGVRQCVPCGEGLTCPFASTVSGLQNGTSDLGAKYIAYVAMVEEGFYSSENDPLSIFRCTEKTHCPGGLPGTCAGGLTSTPCAECPAGQTWSNDQCAECDTFTTVMWQIVATTVVPVGAAVYYYLANPEAKSKAPTRQAAVAAFALVTYLLQTVAILGSTTISWPDNFRATSSAFGILMLDLEGFSFSCFSNLGVVPRYAMMASIFPSLVLWMWLCYTMVKLIPWQSLRWTKNKTWNTIGNLLQMGYGPMTALAFQPFMCYSHPNGLQSLLKQPSILCGGEAHGFMRAVGSLLLAFALGFLALCLLAAWQIPAWTARGYSSVARFNFMTIRFRLDVWWFGVVALVRMPAFSLGVALATDNALAQAALTGSMLVIFLVLLAALQPWKVPILNGVDTWCTMCILLILLAGSQQTAGIETGGAGFAATYTAVLMALFATVVGAVILILAASIADERGIFTQPKGVSTILNAAYGKDARELAEKGRRVAEALLPLEEEFLMHEVSKMNPYDVHMLDQTFDFLFLDLFPGLASRKASPRRVPCVAVRSRESTVGVGMAAVPPASWDLPRDDAGSNCERSEEADIARGSHDGSPGHFGSPAAANHVPTGNPEVKGEGLLEDVATPRVVATEL